MVNTSKFFLVNKRETSLAIKVYLMVVSKPNSTQTSKQKTPTIKVQSKEVRVGGDYF